jgi:hypothetical protein
MVFFFVLLVGMLPLCAETSEQGVTPTIITAILGASLFGIPLAGLAEIVKRAIKKIFKITTDVKWLGYVSTESVIAILTVVVLSPLGMLTWMNGIVSFIIASLVANGLYKMTVKAPAEKAAAEIAKANNL